MKQHKNHAEYKSTSKINYKLKSHGRLFKIFCIKINKLWSLKAFVNELDARQKELYASTLNAISILVHYDLELWPQNLKCICLSQNASML